MMPHCLMDDFPPAFRLSSRPLICFALMVPGFSQQLLIAGPERWFEFAGLKRDGYRAARLARVRAVVKSALARERGNTGEHLVDRVLSRPESQFTQARRVDQNAAARKLDEHAACCRMPTARVGLPNGLGGLASLA